MALVHEDIVLAGGGGRTVSIYITALDFFGNN